MTGISCAKGKLPLQCSWMLLGRGRPPSMCKHGHAKLCLACWWQRLQRLGLQCANENHACMAGSWPKPVMLGYRNARVPR